MKTMNEGDFREAVRNGLGSAILYARENDVRAFRDIILDACLHCYSADVQFEGTRAPHMYELVNLTPDRDFYCGEVLQALHGCGDDWDAVQRFRFASYMAMDGDDRARRAMYENFNPGPRMADQTVVDFVRMDGIDGFLFVADKLGELLITKQIKWLTAEILSAAIEVLGEEQTLAALRKARETNQRVEAYRVAEANRPSAPPSKSNEIRSLTYEGLRPRLSELGPYWLGKWASTRPPMIWSLRRVTC